MIRFSIIDTISERENSKVYLASVEGYDVPMIIKEQKNLNSHILEKLQKINDPHFPELISFEEADGCFTVLEEYIDGITLDAYFKKCKPDKQTQGKIFTEICAALKILHEQEPPIIHRDVKPSNILISENGQVRLIDFNASREFKADSGRDTVNIGTRNYAPPEQFGFSQTDVRSDIYSLGVVISELSDAFPDVVKRCTMFSPEERYASIIEVEEELLKSTSSQFDAMTERETEKKVSGFSVRKLLVPACVFLAAGVILLGVFVLGDSKSRTENRKTETTAASDTAEADIASKKEKVLDMYNPETNQSETRIYYFLNSELEKKESFLLGIPWNEDGRTTEVTYKKNGTLKSSIVPEKYWKRTKEGLELKRDFLSSLVGDALYDVAVESQKSIFGFRICVTDSLGKLPDYYKKFRLSPGYLEYLRDHPGDKFLTYNSYGQVITKIVNMDTGKELEQKDCTIDTERNVLTFSKEFCEALTDDKHISVRIYHTLVDGIEEQEYYEIDAVTREDAYVPPEFEKRDFVYDQSEGKGLEIRLKWNDANGKVEGIYPVTEGAPEIDKKYYRITEDSIIISEKYFQSIPEGDYEYVVEFGDAGGKIQIKVIM